MTSRSPVSTRSRLLTLLRRGATTVERLTRELGVTRTAVRLHLARLERDGLIARSGVQRGRTKPTTLYELTALGERELSRAHAPMLAQLLHVLSARLSPPELDALMRDVGRSMLAGRPHPAGALRDRAEAASAFFDELGALSTVDTHAETLTLRSPACPFADLSARHPAVCSAMEALFQELIGAPVTTCCVRESHPHCCFAIGAVDLPTPAPNGRYDGDSVTSA